jgi:hypothetical protein
MGKMWIISISTPGIQGEGDHLEDALSVTFSAIGAILADLSACLVYFAVLIDLRTSMHTIHARFLASSASTRGFKTLLGSETAWDQANDRQRVPPSTDASANRRVLGVGVRHIV